jgi:aspartyl-tRNA(Asn)/glutamyl-tRNA(Gln) amidotransferase subunit C
MMLLFMSDLSEESIKILGRLSRIKIEEEELPHLFADLQKIIDYVGQLTEIEVGELAPYAHFDEQGIESLREDVVGTTLARSLFLENAPDQFAGMIRVPPVLKQLE